MQIEGVPEGYELVAIRRPNEGELVIDQYGRIEPGCVVHQGMFWPIVRKIERPKRYRPFANAAELEKQCERLVIYKDVAFYKIVAFDSDRVWFGPNNCGYEYKHAFDCMKFADDGTPFGVEVTE